MSLSRMPNSQLIRYVWLYRILIQCSLFIVQPRPCPRPINANANQPAEPRFNQAVPRGEFDGGFPPPLHPQAALGRLPQTFEHGPPGPPFHGHLPPPGGPPGYRYGAYMPPAPPCYAVTPDGTHPHTPPRVPPASYTWPLPSAKNDSDVESVEAPLQEVPSCRKHGNATLCVPFVISFPIMLLI